MEVSELLSIVENGFAIPKGADVQTLVLELEGNLGSSDSIVRENSLEILWHWETQGFLTNSELIDLGNRLATNFSFGLGESGTDNVFLRSFSALVLNGILQADKSFIEGKVEARKPFLTFDLLSKWLDQALEYFIKEQDLRGYVPIKEWAHSIAHCSDLFGGFARHPLTSKKEHLLILDAIARKFTQPAHFIYTTAEEARICRAIATIQTRSLVLPEEYEQWLQQIINPYAETNLFNDINELETFESKLNARVNVRIFLQRLYYMLQYNAQELAETQEEVFKNLSQYSNTLLEIINHGFKKMCSSNLYC
ncbi:MAG: DUF2785 domain-containing protein [Candidatus Heimdallarchaeota archaeon]|nr:DUF2785 domain-containing protein [Candidatus Heimdallarchaeota archaeon]